MEKLDDRWVFLTDPAWQGRQEEGELPPPEAVVGGWFVDANGMRGRFRANPDYLPSRPGSATDPVDAALQLVIRGDADGDELLSTISEGVFGIAVGEDGNAMVTPSPDGVPSVLVATAPFHRARLDVAWRDVTARELADALPDEGVDVLFNPGAPASMRILAGALKEAVAEDEPTDPVDATLRLLGDRRAAAGQLQALLRDTPVDLAMNPDGRPVVTRSPDDVPCVVVATADQHRQGVNPAEWRQVDLTDLVNLLADDVDVLFNPGGPASVRLAGDFIRDTLVLTDDQTPRASG